MEKFRELFQHAKTHSNYYARKYQNINNPSLEDIPILEKEELRQNIDEIVIGDRKKMIEIYTGGTTGKALVVYASRASFADRMALLDLFWQMHGYKFRDRLAWFSGRSLVNKKEEKRNIYWHTNLYRNIRYYSTFHMSFENLPYYVDNMNSYKPQFISGFPAAIHEVARFILLRNMKVEFQPKAIFTTSETLGLGQREIMESVFGCRVRDQYGAAEGPPLIMECPEGKLHLDMAGGIMEVVDEQGKPAQEGKSLVTSFFMRETPIIRYRIGDYIKLSGRIGCPCGWDTPIVAEIMGRKTDFIELPDGRKIWCAQLGDCVKGITSVVKFQAELLDNSKVRIFMVADRSRFEGKDRESFLTHLRECAGDIPVDIVYVDDILRSGSGKHTVVKKS
jgi:phenylacetate-CoA ligase